MAMSHKVNRSRTAHLEQPLEYVDVEHARVDYNSTLVAKWKSMAHRKMRKIFHELDWTDSDLSIRGSTEWTWIGTFKWTDSDGEERAGVRVGVRGGHPSTAC